MKLGRITVLSLLLACTACGPGPEQGPDEVARNILGGQAAQKSDLISRTSVMINFKTEDSVDQDVYCSGTLLSAQFAITAAHCLQDREATTLTSFAGVKTRVRRVITHPSYTRTQEYNRFDLALVEFEPDPRLKDFAEITNEIPPLDADVQIAGYGRTQIGEKSPRKLNFITLKMQSPEFTPSEALLSEGPGRGSCFGDSGGPAYIVSDGRVLLWGVDSRSPRQTGTRCGRFEIYTKPSAAKTWIQSQIQTQIQ